MEKVNFKNSRGLNLIGVFYPSKSRRGIIISHGFTANKDRERLIKLSEKLNKNGFAVLRFDFSGCGGSDNDLISVRGEVDDLKSAINFMKDKDIKKFGLVGESLGGLISLEACSDVIGTMVLFAPVTDKRKPEIEEGIIKTNENADHKGEKFIIHKKEGREFEISEEYLKERASVDKDKLFQKIKCPIFIIHGSNDTTIPIEWSKYAVENLPQDSKLRIIEGAGHKLEEKMDEVIELSINWFREYLK